MRKWLVIFLLMLGSFMGTGVSSESQIGSRTELTNEHVNQLIEGMAANAVGYNFLLDNYNIKTGNVPNSLPMKVSELVRVGDRYGMRMHPILKYKRMHKGIDLVAPKGTPILATANGKVVKAAYSVGYGKMVVIDHGNGVETVYAHLKKLNVEKGQAVSRGEQIAELGSTGMSTGPHLHYEIRIEGAKIDPLTMVEGVTNEDIKESYQKIEDYGRNKRPYYYTNSEKLHEWGVQYSKKNAGHH